jgi:hypothetical protein
MHEIPFVEEVDEPSLKVADFRVGYAENRELPKVGGVTSAGSYAMKGTVRLKDDFFPW